jgi:hypothetical protein
VSAGGPDVTGISGALSTYFTAINDGDYQSAYDQLTPAEQAAVGSEAHFALGDATTYIFDESMGGVVQLSPGIDQTPVAFVSAQAPADGPGGGGDTCDVWTMNYTMVETGGSWLIQSATAQNGLPFTSCG